MEHIPGYDEWKTREQEEEPAYHCPECGRVVEEYVYKNEFGDIVGCDRCLKAKSYWEI